MLKKLFLKIFANKKKNTNFNFSEVKSVLIRPIGGGIGDAIVLTAVFKKLKMAYPNIKIGVFGENRHNVIFENSPLVDYCLEQNLWTCLKHHGKWQIYIDYSPAYTTKRILQDFLIKPTYTICFQKDPKKQYTKDTIKNYDFYIDDLAKAPLYESLNLTPFAPFVNNLPNIYTIPPIQKQDLLYAQELWSKYTPTNKIKILLCPIGSTKRLSILEIKQILESLPIEILQKIQFVIPYSKGIEEYQSLLEIKKVNLVFTNSMSLKQFISFLSNADIVLSVDSAPVHIALAYKKPIIALFANNKRGCTLFAPQPTQNIKVLKTRTIYPQIPEIVKDFDIKEIADNLLLIIKNLER